MVLKSFLREKKHIDKQIIGLRFNFEPGRIYMDTDSENSSRIDTSLVYVGAQSMFKCRKLSELQYQISAKKDFLKRRGKDIAASTEQIHEKKILSIHEDLKNLVREFGSLTWCKVPGCPTYDVPATLNSKTEKRKDFVNSENDFVQLIKKKTAKNIVEVETATRPLP
ncbi:hypothetical protein NPIL_25421 [Nephila pilipes]|uniref:Uncharacterized protein n=1 Tax=Nephila pilipes TaxID=299642 RepID=A0A8X6QUL2_NEPPI|nr:hypothetical protein NPIL_25421 [Nephila pilipes]